MGSPLKTRFIHEVGTRAWLRVYWDDHKGEKPLNTCPNSWGHGKAGYHDARIFLKDSDKLEDWDFAGKVADYSRSQFPQKCDHCGAPTPFDTPPHTWNSDGIHLTLQVFCKQVYNTASGDQEPGDLFFADWYHPEETDSCLYWDNCKGPHLMCVLPNGHHWDIDSRASNCDMKNDRLHRCWVRTGEPPNVDVGKGGLTCGAGAGSIAVPGWHGFLRNGVLTE